MGLMGILKIMEMATVTDLKKLNPSSISPSYFPNYYSTACIPSILGTLQSVGVTILYSFSQPPDILAEGKDGTSGDNATFGVK